MCLSVTQTDLELLNAFISFLSHLVVTNHISFELLIFRSCLGQFRHELIAFLLVSSLQISSLFELSSQMTFVTH